MFIDEYDEVVVPVEAPDEYVEAWSAYDESMGD